MFIAHGEKLRKHARWIMAGVLILLIPGFIMLFTQTGASAKKEGELPTVMGKPINAQAFENARNDIEVQYLINSGKTLPHTAAAEDEVKQRAVVQVLLQQKAKELGLQIPDEEVVRTIQSQPMFNAEGGRFDPERFRRFLIFLNNYGVTEQRFEELMRQQILMDRLQTIVGAAAKATPAEIDEAFNAMSERITIELVEFNVTNFTGSITISNADAQAFYDQNKESFRTPKRVQVRVAKFAVEDLKPAVKISDSDIEQYYDRNKSKYTTDKGEQKPLDAMKAEIRKELTSVRAEQLAGDRATELSVKIAPEPGAPATNKVDFVKLAKELGATVTEPDYFAATGPAEGVPLLPAFRKTAFALGADAPYSDPIAAEDGYYVLQWLGTKASAIPPFEQVKDRVIDRLKRQREYEATVKQGEDTLRKLKQEISSNKTFAVACADLNLQPVTRGPFALADQETGLPAAQYIQETAISMATNAVSEFIPTAQGGLFFYLKNRRPPDETKAEVAKTRLGQQITQRHRQALFNDWVMALLRSEQVNFGRMRSREAQPQPAAEAPETESEPAPVPAATPGKS